MDASFSFSPAPAGEPLAPQTRIRVDDHREARIKLQRTETDCTEHIAELIDISRGGTKLRVGTCLRFEEAVGLHIEIPSVDLNCYVLASVRHIREAGEGRWIVGCAVDPPLNEEAIARLAEQVGVDRRRAPRTPVNVPVSVRRQLGTAEAPGEIVNLSSGGFCIRISESCDAAERIRVALSDASGRHAIVEVRTQWQLAGPQGFLAGCKFLRTEDYEIVRAAAEHQESISPEPTASDPPHYNLWPAAALLACGAIALFILLETRPEVPQSSTAASASSTSPSALITAADDTEAEPAMRAWTDVTGQFQVRATLLDADDTGVLLRRDDGREVRVLLAHLSEVDALYARQWLAEVGRGRD